MIFSSFLIRLERPSKNGILAYVPIHPLFILEGDTIMGDKGSRDKAGKEDRKKPKMTQKEKRKLKKEKKTGGNTGGMPH
jgi:hypothetical protein